MTGACILAASHQDCRALNINAAVSIAYARSNAFQRPNLSQPTKAAGFDATDKLISDYVYEFSTIITVF